MLRKLKNYYHLFQAFLANLLYVFPAKKLTVIGVTGTDGKTTTCSLIYHLLKKQGLQVGLISTVGAKINDENYSIGLHATTPSPFLLQKLLKQMVVSGCQYAVLEITSHAVDQKRIWGIPIKFGILTNITHEHLDYHQTFANYLQTKANFLKNCQTVIINQDDETFDMIKKQIKRKTVTYGLNSKACYFAKNITSTNNQQVFNINENVINTSLLGLHNVYNILASFALCRVLGLSEKQITDGLKDFTNVKGRFEIILEKPFKVIVDFAHTPNAFKFILPAVRDITQGKIIHVFGATGKRDVFKRPLMGEISGNLSNISILTSEDTYGENPEKIINDLETGIKKTNKKLNKTYFIVPDRKEAIKNALSLVKDGDSVLLTGVGHQTTLNLGNKEFPWSEKEVVLELLNKS